MAFTAHPGSIYNAIGSFNNHFVTQLTGAGLPAWMPSAVTNFEYPALPLTFPSFSVTHLTTEAESVAEGQNLDPGYKGYRRRGLAEVSVWESVQRAAGAHVRNVQQMRDMAARLFATGSNIGILDLYAGTANPSGLTARLWCGPVRDAPVGPDPNPDVIRRRMLVPYEWLERVTT